MSAEHREIGPSCSAKPSAYGCSMAATFLQTARRIVDARHLQKCLKIGRNSLTGPGAEAVERVNIQEKGLRGVMGTYGRGKSVKELRREKRENKMKSASTLKPISPAIGPARVGGVRTVVLGAGFFFCTSSRISGGAARPRLVSNVSVFSRKRTFRSPHIFESNENWGFGRDCWVSAGLFVRALLASGSEHFNGIFVWERPRSALRVAFQISSAFHF